MLDAHDFVEIETPTLTRSTPEGARDFLVPARLAPGSWYALPQSPQLFKQLLMVAGMERYYQIARCYRDEDFRADRQPEFTQLDIEMSFVEQDDVIELGEEIVAALWRLIGVDVADADAADDLRRGDGAATARTSPTCASATSWSTAPSSSPDTAFRVFQADVRRRGRHARRRLAAAQAARRLAGVGQAARRQGPGLRAGRRGRRARRPGGQEPHRHRARPAWPPTSAPSPGDCIFFGAGAAKASRALLGAARLEIGRRCGLIDEDAWAFLWVLDAPLFEPTAEAVAAGDVAVGSGAWTAVHHAFTSPKAEFLDTFDTDPGSALAYAYDMVCNGNEIGGGSIRIHRRDVQERVFEVMGLVRGGGAGEVRLPARRVRVRRAAARRHRLRLGPHLRAARRAPSRSARSSPSRSPAAATTR